MLDRIQRAIDALRSGGLAMIVERDQNQAIVRAHLVAAAEKISTQIFEQLALSSDNIPALAVAGDTWDRLSAGETVSAKIAKSADRPAVERALTVRSVLDPKRSREDFESPGCLLKISTSERGTLECAEPGETAVDLARMAGLFPAAILLEIPEPKARSLEGAHASLSCAELVAYRFRHEKQLRRSAEAALPTDLGGELKTIFYESAIDRAEHVALVKGDLSGSEPVLVRIHSKCLTGDTLGSQRCDCGPQLRQALAKLSEVGRGVLLYLDQEGRGIGLVNKLKAYALQDRGFDTVSANEQLGFAADIRDYGIAAQMLFDLGVRRVSLMTNNPRKVAGLTALGIDVADRVPLEVSPNPYNLKYLLTKREKLGHLLTAIDEQSES